MKARLYTILQHFSKDLLPICLLAFFACEKEVEFESPSEQTAVDVVINAVAVEGEPLTVFLNHAYSIGKQPVFQYVDYQHAMYSINDYLSDYRDSYYYKNAGIFNAEVTAVVNDSQTYNLTLAADSMGYVCDYRPQVNDHIMLKANYESHETSAETTVPAKPSIEVLKHTVLNDDSYYEVNNLRSFSDTIMRITCNIKDAGGEQYYRLRIRGERSWKQDYNLNPLLFDTDKIAYTYYVMQDVFFSESALFVDARLNKNFGGWPAYFSNVFNNSLMSGNDYTLTLDSPKPVPLSTSYNASFERNADGSYTIISKLKENSETIAPRVMVELQAISPELYRYLKSVELYRITESDAFSEPVQIYSNVQNGWGIFGSLSSQRIIIPYD